jgi:hypothetical protein
MIILAFSAEFAGSAGACRGCGAAVSGVVSSGWDDVCDMSFLLSLERDDRAGSSLSIAKPGRTG